MALLLLAETQLGPGGVRVHAPRVCILASRMDLFLPAVRRASGDGARSEGVSRCSRASELGLPCSGVEIFQQIRSTPRQLPAPAGFTGGLPGRVPPAAAASLGSGCELAPRRGHVRDGRPDKIDRSAMAAVFSAVCCNWDRSRMYHGASLYISTCKHVEKRAYGSGLYHTKPVLLLSLIHISEPTRPY